MNRCPTCARYGRALIRAVADRSGATPMPSTRDQVRHEWQAHGGPKVYYRELNS